MLRARGVCCTETNLTPVIDTKFDPPVAVLQSHNRGFKRGLITTNTLDARIACHCRLAYCRNRSRHSSSYGSLSTQTKHITGLDLYVYSSAQSACIMYFVLLNFALLGDQTKSKTRTHQPTRCRSCDLYYTLQKRHLHQHQQQPHKRTSGYTVRKAIRYCTGRTHVPTP